MPRATPDSARRAWSRARWPGSRPPRRVGQGRGRRAGQPCRQRPRAAAPSARGGRLRDRRQPWAHWRAARRPAESPAVRNPVGSTWSTASPFRRSVFGWIFTRSPWLSSAASRTVTSHSSNTTWGGPPVRTYRQRPNGWPHDGDPVPTGTTPRSEATAAPLGSVLSAPGYRGRREDLPFFTGAGGIVAPETRNRQAATGGGRC